MTYIWERQEWPDWRWNDAALSPFVQRAAERREFLAGLVRGLDGNLVGLTLTEMLTQESVATSAIEGVRVDAAAVRSSLMKRLGLGVAADHVPRLTEAEQGLVAMLADSTENGGALTRERLFAWHAALFPVGRSILRQIAVGDLRGPEPMRVVSGAPGREVVHFEAPPRERLDREIDRFLDWFNGDSRPLDSLVRASVAHLWFETLHPFEDGNGRLGRAVMDLALASHASNLASRLWSVSTVIQKHKEDYYDQLERAQKGNLDITEWLTWILVRIDEAYAMAIACAERVGQVAKFWTRHSDTPLNERQRKVLRRVLESDQEFVGGLTARKYANLTHCDRVTASRELSSLVAAGCIQRNPGTAGRNVSYSVVLTDTVTPRVAEQMVWL